MSTSFSWSKYSLNFRYFPKREDFIAQGLEAFKYNVEAARKSSETYTGKINFLEQMKNEKLYAYQAQLKTSLEEFDSLKDTIDMGGAFKKQRLIVTDDERGIFSFGLASQGLYRVQEYYSAELATDNPDEFPGHPPGVVPPKLVDFTIGLMNEKLFWYSSSVTGKKYELRKQQAGSAEILIEDTDAVLETHAATGMLFAKASRLDLTSRLIFKTRNKKSYVMFEKKGGKAKMVEIYIPIHADVNLTSILPIMLVAKLLAEYGVQTRISAIRMYHEQGELFVMWGYPVKDYGEEMDYNALALNSAFVNDNWWAAVQNVVKNINDMEIIKKNGGYKQYTRYYSATGSQAGSVDDYVEVFSRYRNWYMEQIKVGKVEPLRVDKKLMLIGKAADYGPRQDRIMNEFFRILDTVDFQFNKPEDAVKRIYKRMVEDKVTKWYEDMVLNNQTPRAIETGMANQKRNFTAECKLYIQNTLTATYHYPVGGEYAEPAESAAQLEEELDEKLEAMNKFLATV